MLYTAMVARVLISMGIRYVLHVTVKSVKQDDELVPPGFIIDFKELKRLYIQK
jgi:6-pyruvoyl-tetrahydropterin synthase